MTWGNWIVLVSVNGGFVAFAMLAAFAVIYPIWSVYKEKLQRAKMVSDRQVCVLLALIGAKYTLGIGGLLMLTVSIARVATLTTSAIL